jgi:hypothetical protein
VSDGRDAPAGMVMAQQGLAFPREVEVAEKKLLTATAL